MNHFNNKFIGICLKNYRNTIGLNQDVFVSDICTLYTLSRIERGLTEYSFTLLKLLNHYQMHLNYLFDFTILEIEYKNLLEQITYGNSKEIEACVLKILEITNANKSHLIMYQYHKYACHLKAHFIDNKAIIFDKHTFNTMCFLSNEMYIVHFHITLENAFKHASVMHFKPLYLLMYRDDVHHIMIDIYSCLYYQSQELFLQSHDISSFHKLDINDNSYHLHHVRYRIIDAISYATYEPARSICEFNEIIEDVTTYKQDEMYTFLCYLGQVATYIKIKKYEEALSVILNHLIHFHELKAYVYPYGVLLTMILDVEMDERLLEKTDHKLITRIQSLYVQHNRPISTPSKFGYLNGKVLFLCKYFNENSSLILLLYAYARILNRKTKLKRQYVRFELTIKDVIRRSL